MPSSLTGSTPSSRLNDGDRGDIYGPSCACLPGRRVQDLEGRLRRCVTWIYPGDDIWRNYSVRRIDFVSLVALLPPMSGWHADAYLIIGGDAD